MTDIVEDNQGILLSEKDGSGVLRLTLNDVSKRNALSELMLKELTKSFVEASDDTSVRTVILAANGAAFCAGHDLKEMTAGRKNEDYGRVYYTRIMKACSAMMQGIVNCPKPVIAEVTGVATAAGCQLVASCDLAVAADNARFSTPGVHIGLFCSTPMVALSRNIATKHAMEMLLIGDMIPADRAAEMGLINRVATPESLTEVTMEMARKIASKSSMTVATGKRAFYKQREMELAEAYDYASKIMVDNMLANDAEEGINAFIEKRPPQWQDK